MTDYETLKEDMERWMQQLGIVPPANIHDYVAIIRAHVEDTERYVNAQNSLAQAEITRLRVQRDSVLDILNEVANELRLLAQMNK